MCQIALANAQSWSLTGNSSTSPSTNFLGTTDNVAFLLKTNSIQRVSVSESNSFGTRDISYVTLGTAGSNVYQGELNIYGSDIAGHSIPLFVSCDITGLTYSYVAGVNNTLGRLIRFNQGNTGSLGGSHFYDIGMQDSSLLNSLFITQHLVPGGGFFPKKMFTISSDDNVGINLDWSDLPTANLHTKGTVRHEGLPSGEGYYIVADDDGNLYMSNCSSARTCLIRKEEEIEELKNEIAELKNRMDLNNSIVKDAANAKIALHQNIPNPFTSSTTLGFVIPSEITKAYPLAELFFKSLRQKMKCSCLS
jgi:hypothetical protein